MRWVEFEAAAPEFASRVRTLLQAGRHLTMATLRRDGSPRISGTEVEFVDGDLLIGSPPAAVKALDLRRDGRLAIHGRTQDPLPTDPASWPGEAKVAGRAVEGEPGRFWIDLHEAVITSLNAAGDRLVIESWHPNRGYQRVERV